jgi:hypothetical protein
MAGPPSAPEMPCAPRQLCLVPSADIGACFACPWATSAVTPAKLGVQSSNYWSGSSRRRSCGGPEGPRLRWLGPCPRGRRAAKTIADTPQNEFGTTLNSAGRFRTSPGPKHVLPVHHQAAINDWAALRIHDRSAPSRSFQPPTARRWARHRCGCAPARAARGAPR